MISQRFHDNPFPRTQPLDPRVVSRSSESSPIVGVTGSFPSVTPISVHTQGNVLSSVTSSIYSSDDQLAGLARRSLTPSSVCQG